MSSTQLSHSFEYYAPSLVMIQEMQEGVPEVEKEGVPEMGKEGVTEVGKAGVSEVGKGGAGLHLPPDVLDLLFGALELPLLLHQPARPAPHQPNCHVPPANSDDALVSK